MYVPTLLGNGGRNVYSKYTEGNLPGSCRFSSGTTNCLGLTGEPLRLLVLCLVGGIPVNTRIPSPEGVSLGVHKGPRRVGWSSRTEGVETRGPRTMILTPDVKGVTGVVPGLGKWGVDVCRVESFAYDPRWTPSCLRFRSLPICTPGRYGGISSLGETDR